MARVKVCCRCHENPPQGQQAYCGPCLAIRYQERIARNPDLRQQIYAKNKQRYHDQDLRTYYRERARERRKNDPAYVERKNAHNRAWRQRKKQREAQDSPKE